MLERVFSSSACQSSSWRIAWPFSPRVRWVFVVREGFLALIGVGLAVEPWARSGGNTVALVGFLGLLVMAVLGRRLRGEVRRAP
jgi:hypothetical protein